jgi:hypothetical protein
MSPPLAQKQRFEVLKRDKFTCRYCGAKAPDAVLHVDHIQPRSKGGTNDLMNLVTACKDCNSGKKARLLGDLSASVANREAMEKAQDQAEQLRMMAEWQAELAQVDQRRHDLINGVLTARFQFRITGAGLMAKVDHAISKAGLEKFIQSADGVRDWMAKQDETPDDSSIMDRIFRMMKYGDRHTDPKAAAAYVVGIMRNRFNLGWRHLKGVGEITIGALNAGATYDELEHEAKACERWLQYISLCAVYTVGKEMREEDARNGKPPAIDSAARASMPQPSPV